MPAGPGRATAAEELQPQAYMQRHGTVNLCQSAWHPMPEATDYFHPQFSPDYPDSVLVPIATAQDEQLSWAARGMLLYLLSLPKDFVFTDEDLVDSSPGGADLMRSILRELEATGYLQHAEHGYYLVLKG